MKSFSKKSIVPLIKVILNISWYSGIAGIWIGATFAIYCLIASLSGSSIFDTGKPWSLDLPGTLSFSYSKEAQEVLTSQDANWGNLEVKTVITRVSFEKNQNIIAAVFILINSISFLLGLFIIYILRKIFADLPEKSPFTHENYKRIRLIGILTIGVAIGEYIFSGGLFLFISSKYEKITGFNDSVPLVDAIVAGLFILAIAEIFNHGVKLKEEQELTV